jgi:hypothetical protein
MVAVTRAQEGLTDGTEPVVEATAPTAAIDPVPAIDEAVPAIDGGTPLTPTTVIDHVLSRILQARDGSNYHRAFIEAGVVTITDFLEISKDEWTAIAFPVPVPTAEEPNATVVKSLSMVQVKKLTKLVLWYQHQQELSAVPVSYLSWYYDLTFDSFEAFRDQSVAVVAPPQALAAPVDEASLVDAQRLAAFEKGRRRNINDFSKFTDPKNWGAWKRRMIASAQSFLCACRGHCNRVVR